MNAFSEAVEAWAGYCLRFGHRPAALVGFSYPGKERFPMSQSTAEIVSKSLKRFPQEQERKA